MKRTLPALCLVFAIMSCPLLAADPGTPRANEVVQGAKALIARVVGRELPDVRLHYRPAASGRDEVDVECKNGVLTLSGSSGVALARGFYCYVREACGQQVTWSSREVHLPANLPDFAAKSYSTPFHFRQQFNVCAFGYTTVWWDWKRWEQELDWMALHGINMALSMGGQELIWQRVWQAQGLKDEDIASFFSGPAFLPWHRMGNINHHGGPLPQSWMEQQRDLQKKILGRMKVLGIEPVVPAFAGFVPPAFLRLHPGEIAYPIPAWGGFPPDCQTYLLSPASQFFVKIGAEFIREYRKEYGPMKHYLADSFNELDVPVSTEHRYDELAGFGKAVFQSINEGDPHGTWVMQGWLFYNDAAFWDSSSVKALLRDVPDDRMIILDLANEMFQGWKTHRGFYGKQWIYSVINNFGGNNPVNGDLKKLATGPSKMLRDPNRGHVVGAGLAPEGIENNEAVYELATDAFWSNDSTDLPAWIHSYCTSRYGGCPPAMEEAWRMLLRSVYAHSWANIRHAFQLRPSMDVQGNVATGKDVAEALALFLACESRLGSSRLYKNDLLELAVQVLGGEVDNRFFTARRAHREGQPGLRDTLWHEAHRLLVGIDRLVAWRQDMRLERWVDDARQWGRSQAEKDYYEENARRQVTLWGGPELHDYASKVWSGLIRDFYLPRWDRFFELLCNSSQYDTVPVERLVEWEEAWVRSTALSPSIPVSDPVAAARALLEESARGVKLAPAPGISPETGYCIDDTTIIVTIGTVEGAVVRYTLDGTEPSETSTAYSGPFAIHHDLTVSARAFRTGEHPSFVTSMPFSFLRNGVNGVHLRYAEGEWNHVPDFDTVKIVREGTAYEISLRGVKTREDFWGVEYSGTIRVPKSGLYTFSVTSDDGSKLWIDGRVVVDNDGNHASDERLGGMSLSEGDHKIKVAMYDHTGAQVLNVKIQGAGMPLQPIPSSWLFLRQ